MTPRSLRRAQERQARKEMDRQARKEIDGQARKEMDGQARKEMDREISATAPSTEQAQASELQTSSSSRVSEAQRLANQANAQLSTGPKSFEGKSTSSLNAVKTALTGRTVLLPSDDAAAYQQHIQAWQDDLRPVGARECDLVQSIADTTWRLRRIPCLESAIFALGRAEFADSFNDHAPDLRASLIELQTFLQYEKQLRNLQLQEARLARRRQQDLAELQQLQQERRTAELEAKQAALALVAARYTAAQNSHEPLELSVNGFVFSTAQIEQHLASQPSRKPLAQSMKQAA